MYKQLTRFLVLAAIVCAASVATATQYPNATCTDSVTIQQIQDASSLCHPIAADTVRGVTGVIIGFDPIATGFDAYIQTPAGGPFSGIDFFTHSTNTKNAPFSFAIGDQIVVEFAAVAEFQNATEVLAANNSFGAPNFIVRKLSSGNALPPFFVGTATQLKELPTNTFFEQYEGCLVRINGPLTVVRTSLTGGLGTNGFLCIDPSAPSDSVFVDGNKLTTYAPPALGTNIVSVQGIGNQATRGYRIMLRDGNDIVTLTPPNVADAYPLTDNTILVKFDRDVTNASATTASNYSLSSFGSIDAVSMPATDRVILTITNGLLHGQLETVTVNGVVGLAAGVPMTTPQSRTFVNGVLSAAEVQEADADSLGGLPCLDRSRFAGGGGQITQGGLGTRATMQGIMSGRFGSVYYVVDPGNGRRSGVAAFAPPAVLTAGHNWRLTGQIQEFFGETEFSNIIDATDLGVAAIPAAKIISVIQAARDTCDFTNALDDGEDYEGRLVTLPNVKVVQRFATLPTNGFHVADQSFPDTIFVENFNAVLTPLIVPSLGQILHVTGHVHFSNSSFRIVPRDRNDVRMAFPAAARDSVTYGTIVRGDTGHVFIGVPGTPELMSIDFRISTGTAIDSLRRLFGLTSAQLDSMYLANGDPDILPIGQTSPTSAAAWEPWLSTHLAILRTPAARAAGRLREAPISGFTGSAVELALLNQLSANVGFIGYYTIQNGGGSSGGGGNGCTGVPDFGYTSCCNNHDVCYTGCGLYGNRLDCDLALWECMGGGFLADLYYRGVRIFGGSHWCTPLLAGVSPDGALGPALVLKTNPARVARIAFTIPSVTDVDLSVFDVSGRRVATLVHTRLGPGERTAEWGTASPDRLSHPGLYFVRLRAGGVIRSTPFILIH